MAVPTSAFPPVEVRLTPNTNPAAADTKIDTTKLNPCDVIVENYIGLKCVATYRVSYSQTLQIS